MFLIKVLSMIGGGTVAATGAWFSYPKISELLTNEDETGDDTTSTGTNNNQNSGGGGGGG